MAQTLEQHSMARFVLTDVQPKLKFDSRNPSVMDEITFYLNYPSYNSKLISLRSMSAVHNQAACIPENADFIETLSEDDPVTLEDMADYERSKDELDEFDFDDDYIDFEGEQQ